LETIEGFRFTGHKMFGSLTPVWTRMGLHGMDNDHPDGPRIIHAFLSRGTEGMEVKEICWKVVDQAMDVSGGNGMFKSSELERLFRDARCGRFHPATSSLVHEIVGKTALGIDLGEQPRWG